MKYLKNSKYIFILSLLLIFSFSLILGLQISTVNVKTVGVSNQEHLKRSVTSLPINIDGNAELAVLPGISGGGTEANPYIIEDLEIEANETGIYIIHTSKHLIIRNCIISNGRDGDFNGINIQLCSNITILSNQLVNNLEGIRVSHSLKINITNNICENNRFYGIDSSENSNMTIKSNKCYSNEASGIRVVNGEYFEIIENLCYQNLIGINAENLNESLFRNNDLYDNTDLGISFLESKSNKFISNSVHDNSKGLILDSSVQNEIWENTFANNIDYNVLCSASDNNQWDNDLHGNYWDDYLEKYPDATNDGEIWDTPFKIDGTSNTYDNFPLVNPVHNLGGNILAYSSFIPVTMICLAILCVLVIFKKQNET